MRGVRTSMIFLTLLRGVYEKDGSQCYFWCGRKMGGEHILQSMLSYLHVFIHYIHFCLFTLCRTYILCAHLQSALGSRGGFSSKSILLQYTCPCFARKILARTTNEHTDGSASQKNKIYRMIFDIKWARRLTFAYSHWWSSSCTRPQSQFYCSLATLNLDSSHRPQKSNPWLCCMSAFVISFSEIASNWQHTGRVYTRTLYDIPKTRPKPNWKRNDEKKILYATQ